MKSIVWHAVAEYHRRQAGFDPFHPPDQNFGVSAVNIHARPIDVEVAQRNVGHRKCPEHSFPEQLGDTVKRAVVMTVMSLRRRKFIGQAIDRSRRCVDNLLNAGVGAHTGEFEGRIDHPVERLARFGGAVRDPKRGLMKDNVRSTNEMAHQATISDVTLDKRDV